MSDPPIACTLSPRELPARRALLDALARDGMIDRSATTDGLRVRLRDSAGIEERVRRVIALESRCCPFLDFRLGRDDGALELDIAGALVLDIAAPPEARPVIEMLFAPGDA